MLSLRRLAPALVLLSAFAHAQTPEAPPPVPTQSNLPIDAPLNPRLPTVFIVGDSTARNGKDLGWGDHFAALFDTSRINVANRAVAGRSSRTYINEGRWDKVLAELKPGDFVLIQMGHNDGAGTPQSVQNDAKGRSTLKGVGEETVDVPITRPYSTGPLTGKTTETVHTYGHNLRKYITESRAKGATPILLTVTVRNIWKPGPTGKDIFIERDMGFREFENQIAATEHVAVADMASISADNLEALGPEKTAALYPIDHTHTSPEGADLNAHAVADALRQIHSPLATYLKPR